MAAVNHLPSQSLVLARLAGTVVGIALLLFPATGLAHAPHPATETACNAPPAGLVSWWRGNGDANDFIGGHHGTLHGDATFATGMVGQAFAFDGEDDYMSVPDDPAWDFGMNDFTIDLWVLLHQIKNSMFIHQQLGSGAGGFEFDLQPPSGMLVFSRDEMGTAIERNWVPQVETWYHIAVTRTAGVYRLYVNGSQVGNPQIDSMPVADVSGPLRIGGWAFGNSYDVSGLIDELDIVHRALSDQEIADIYAAGSGGKCPTYATRVQPSEGGNGGAVTVVVQGIGFQTGAAVKLARSGEPDIAGAPVTVAVDGASLVTTLDLGGAAGGAWDVVVTNPDASLTRMPQAFLIQAAEAPQLRVAVLGSSLMRANRRTAFDVVIENPGNEDAAAVPLWIAGVPAGATVELGFVLGYPPRGGGEPDWSTVPLGFTSANGRYVPIVFPRVPPGSTARRIYLTVPTGVSSFKLRAAVTPPWADGNRFRGCLTGGGVITNPACMGSQLTAIDAYLASHLELEGLSGVGVWAKEAWSCEGSSTLPAALIKAEQVLDYMVGAVESPSSTITACSDVLPPRWRDSLVVTIVGAVDPNEKLGAQGTLPLQQAIPYSIRFENKSSATAPAQVVVVSDPLSLATLDPATVSLDAITFGSIRIVPPPGLSSYATTVDLRPAKQLLVQVSGVVDKLAGVVSWNFTSIDPATGTVPADPLVGFLPPNLVPPEGEGSVLFTVLPRPGLAGGTQIANGASITFDENAPNVTPTWINAVDNTPPSSQVLPLSANSDLTSVQVSWTAAGGAGDLRDYTVYVAEDGGPYRVWRLNTAATADTLVPPRNFKPHTYAFYSVARDVSGNIEPAPTAPDATTQTRTAVGDEGVVELALEGARPNPAREALRVWFTLPSRERATLDVMDVAGRRVLRREVGSMGPGTHAVTLGGAPTLRPGLYFVRLIQGKSELNARVAVIR